MSTDLEYGGLSGLADGDWESADVNLPAVADRLPLPDWTRSGETWRVEEEPGWSLDAAAIVCAHRGGRRGSPERCERGAIAVRSRSGFALCIVHLREAGMWIEDGRVVSWALRP